MSSTMNEKDLEQLKAHVTELAKGLKSEADLSSLTQQLVKMTVEAALGAELDEHLGYEKHDPTGRGSGNSRNGTTRKRLKGQHGEVEVEQHGHPPLRKAEQHGHPPFKAAECGR